MFAGMSLLDQSTVLITGASSGLGVEFARQLAPRARCLILTARRTDRLEALKAELTRTGLEIHCLPVDLSNEADVDRFLGEVRALGVRANVLINNAGLGDHGMFENGEWPRVRAMLHVNMSALTRLTHAFVKDLVAQGQGGILNVSSIVGLMPIPQMAVYAATKAYVLSFSEALRAELRGTGVSVLALCPGPVDTEFFPLAERPGTEEVMAAPAILKVSAEKVVRNGLSALEKDRARIIPGWLICSVMTAAALTPMFIKRYFLNRRGRGFKGH
jgi:short-subunit dehydrogenase